MSTRTDYRAALVAGLLLTTCVASAAPADQGAPFGFGATPGAGDLARFVSPLADGRGLPAGSGSAADGEKLYQTQCVACHGATLQGGIGDRLVGGRGTLVNDDPTKAPVKTVESFWPYATTLFDYIKRAMPLMAPGSLSDDEVYALSAYILSQAKIVAADAVLDQSTLARVRMPNRDGFVPDRRPEVFPSVAKSPHRTLAIPDPAR